MVEPLGSAKKLKTIRKSQLLLQLAEMILITIRVFSARRNMILVTPGNNTSVPTTVLTHS